MFTKYYPRNQIKRYLIMDVASVIFLLHMVFSSQSAMPFLIKTMLLIIFFICFYLGLWVRDYRLIIVTLIGCIILTIFSVYINISLILFGFIFADILGRAKEKIYMSIGILILAFMFITVILHGGGFAFISKNLALLPLMIFQMVLPIVIHIVEKSKTLQVELNEANELLEEYLLEEERNRIARDLHDTLGQTLTMIKVKSELTERLIDKNPDAAKKEIGDILSSSRTAIKQVRELVTGMKFISLENEINNSIKQLKERHIETIIRKAKPLPSMSKVEETMLALSVREAITNIIRHSQAKRCVLSFESDPMKLIMTVEDDGIGFDRSHYGNGLSSIKERLHSIKGTCTIYSSHQNGTRLTLEVPLERK